MNKVKYKFKFWMSSKIWDAAWVKRICLYCRSAGGTWRKIELKQEKSNDSWNIEDGSDVKMFRKFFATQDQRSIFCSVKFAQRSQLVAQYDFDSWWNFEIQIKPDKSGRVLGIFGSPKRKKYIIKRDKKRAELPSFAWRKKLDKYK